MKSKVGIIGIILLWAIVTGCTTSPFTTEKPPQKTPQELAEPYLAKAREFEAEGDLVEALEQYKLVLTVDPANQLAQEKSRLIGQDLQQLAEKHYQDGLNDYQSGQYATARQEFLTALRYDPEHQPSQKMLTSHEELEQVDRYVLHTIQPNETIATLAKQYYGDYKKFHLIALYNKLDDATMVTVGQQIKVPVIEGVPIVVDPSKIQTVPGKDPKARPADIIAVKRYITHTVKPEESLSKLSKRYYGDFKKFDLIAKFNDMQVTDSLRVGQQIKIPEVEGVAFLVPSDGENLIEVETPASVPVEDDLRPPESAEETRMQEVETSAEDQAVAYREFGIELYEQEKYDDAIIELQKALNANPDDGAARTYLSLTYLEQGIILFNNRDYSRAVDAFNKSREYDNECGTCGTYIQKSKESFKDLHYRKGVTLFGEEKLAEAIEEWEMVYKLDPDYKDVDKNIEKTKKLMERLEEIKRSKVKK